MTQKDAEIYGVKLKAGVIVRHRGKVLLIRERHNSRHPYRWNIIKGTFEPGRDASILDAAIREAREEANAKIKLKWFLGSYYLLDSRDALMMFTFIADLLNSNIQVLPEENQAKYSKSENIAEVRLFTRKELTQLKPKDFVGLRGYLAIRDYLKGTKFPLGVINTLSPKPAHKP